MTFWLTPHFKALQKAWYERLKAEGFEDAEELLGGDLRLREATDRAYRALDDLSRSAKEEYYSVLSQKVQEETFSSPIDQFILELFSEGKKIKHICETLRSLGLGRSRGTIRFRIRVYEVKWGLREYSDKEMNGQTGRRCAYAKKLDGKAS